MCQYHREINRNRIISPRGNHSLHFLVISNGSHVGNARSQGFDISHKRISKASIILGREELGISHSLVKMDYVWFSPRHPERFILSPAF